MAALLVTGVVLVSRGWQWFRKRQMKYPLSILTGTLALGLAYIAHQRFGIFDSASASLLVVLVATLVSVAVAYIGPAEPDPV